MKKPITLICMGLLVLAALATALLGGCGTGDTQSTGTTPGEVQEQQESTSPESSNATEAEDRQALEDMVNKKSAETADFDHNTFGRVAFATDSAGTEWALIEVETFTKSSPDSGTTEFHVFKQANGDWTQVSAGTSGYSEGVPEDVQKQLNIEGQ
ncbi:MAG: hypothetical protein ACYC99_10240 [Candidatus Geothermincolia bacterium]